MNTDRVWERNGDQEKGKLLNCFLIGVLVFPMSVFAYVPLLGAQIGGSYVVIDQHIFGSQSIPPGYERFITEAREAERITLETLCWGDTPGTSQAHPCVISFFPRYPYHHIPSDAKKKLVTGLRDVGGTFLDWAFTEGKFAALGWSRDGYFTLAWLDSRGNVHFSPSLDVPNGDIQSEFGIDSPGFDFCTDPPARLLLPWDQSALVGCFPYRSVLIQPFFVFPVRYVHQWWNNSGDMSGKRPDSDTRLALVDIFWEGWFESGSSKVRIPVHHGGDLSRYEEILTLDLETGEFFKGKQRIFPAPNKNPCVPQKINPGRSEGSTGPEIGDSGGEDE